MVLDRVKRKNQSPKPYFVLPNINEKKWELGKGTIRFDNNHIYGKATAFITDFQVGDLIAVEADTQPPSAMWYF